MCHCHSVVEDPAGNRVANRPPGGADENFQPGIVEAVDGLMTTVPSLPTVFDESGALSIGSLTGQDPVVRRRQPASSSSDRTGR